MNRALATDIVDGILNKLLYQKGVGDELEQIESSIYSELHEDLVKITIEKLEEYNK